MFFSRKPKSSQASAAAPAGSGAPPVDRRNSTRYQTTVLTCGLGEITELSRSGLRLRSTGSPAFKVGDKVQLDICSPTECAEVDGRIVRIKPSSYGRFDVGVAFEGLSDAVAGTLENLARYGTTKAEADPRVRAEQLRRLTASMKLPDHYKTLGLTPSASAKQVQDAFRALAREFHPDLNKSPEAERRFCEINEANEVLSDESRRKAYDALAGYIKAA